MTEPLDALRGYVHYLHEREGVREVKLSKAAREGLEKLKGGARDKSSEVTSAGSRRPPGDGGVAVRDTSRSANTSDPVARRSTATTEANDARKAPHQIEAIAAPPIEVSGSTKAEQLRHLAERASVCVKCPHLAARRTTVVFGVGNPDAKLMFVGEAPGEDEDLQGEPFVGRAGQLLTKMIVAMGLSREQVYIGNIVKCRPDMPVGASGNRKPTKQEMETCVPYLRAQIDVIKPTALVALGATAVEGLLGPVGNIGTLRGKFLEYRNTPLMPTYHPSYLLRNQSNTEKRKVWEDLLKVMERLELPITEKQRGFFLAK
jgi:DNA polymerase